MFGSTTNGKVSSPSSEPMFDRAYSAYGERPGYVRANHAWTSEPVADSAKYGSPTQTASIPGPTQSTANADAFGLPAPVFGPAPAGRSADDATLRALEEAVAQAILADLTVATAAARVGLSRDALAQLVAHYREIGRRALAGEK